MRIVTAFLIVCAILVSARGQGTKSFDGRRWNISSGNLSVAYIQASPIGAYPRADMIEAPPSFESQTHLRDLGLVANEDYIAWGAVERAPGAFQWQQHDAMEKTLHAAGLKYVVYDWVHFPPVWLRDDQKDKRTLMRCIEHNRETHYLSIFDPRTIDWYDHFYKNLHDHFGSRIDDVYACILGPYGEGNYPLEVAAWVNMGHCHEGYWCGDAYGTKAFELAMQRKYRGIGQLNRAWAAEYNSFNEVRPPNVIMQPNFKANLAAFPKPEDKRRWLDFITWYHQAIIDFSERSVQTVLKYYPKEKVRLKPGGNYGSVNPLPWGTYCPGYAKMAQPYGIVLQPADCQGAVFGDKWVGTAYQFYGIKQCTEPAGGLDEKSFVRRMFSDASSGASQLFTYEFEQHAATVQKYIQLFTGKSGDTDIAVYCPTTLYRLGASLQWTIEGSVALRDLCEFDVLDELLIADGALTTNRYKTLLVFQADIVEQDILDRLTSYLRGGGRIVILGNTQPSNVEGHTWTALPKATRIITGSERDWRRDLAVHLKQLKGYDGELDGVWTCRRAEEAFFYNSSKKAATVHIDGKSIDVAPFSIASKQ